MSNVNYPSEHKKENLIKAVLRFVGTVLVIVLIIPVFIVIFPFMIPHIVTDISFRFKFREVAVSQGKFILFVYSDSPIWKSYIEHNILPQIQNHAVILNWSERSKWDKTSWAVRAFQHWGGLKNFNPLGIVFCNLAKVRVIRFYGAFHDYKHGKIVSLQKVESQFFELIKAKVKTQAPLNTA